MSVLTLIIQFLIKAVYTSIVIAYNTIIGGRLHTLWHRRGKKSEVGSAVVLQHPIDRPRTMPMPGAGPLTR